MDKNAVTKDVLNFVGNFVANIPYFNPREVVLECTECGTHLYHTTRETVHMESLKPHDFEAIFPQSTVAEYKVECSSCKKETKPVINYLHEGHKRGS